MAPLRVTLHKYAPYAEDEACAELVPHIDALKARRDEMVAAALNVLQSLTSEADLMRIRRQMAIYDEYGNEVDEARDAVRAHVRTWDGKYSRGPCILAP